MSTQIRADEPRPQVVILSPVEGRHWLNGTQRIILLAGAGCFALMGLFPPWRYGGARPPLYAPIFNPPPTYQPSLYVFEVAYIDTMRLWIPMLVVLLATIAGVLVAARRAK